MLIASLQLCGCHIHCGCQYAKEASAEKPTCSPAAPAPEKTVVASNTAVKPSTSNSSGFCPCQEMWKETTPTNVTVAASPTSECRFDPMPIDDKMSFTEKLNRTR